MPAWTDGRGERFIGCKIVSRLPRQCRPSKPAVYGTYLLMSGDTGEPLAVIDGTALTPGAPPAPRRSPRLSRARGRRASGMIGAGALAPL